MEPINTVKVQEKINEFANQEVYIHLETTNGAYASHFNESFFSAGAYIRNAKVKYEHGKITGDGPFRVGIKMEIGWIYAEGITHFEVDEHNRLLLAGHGYDGKLAVALEISKTPFDI
ncbi:YojF family protein [Bacillus sp. FJAT-49736]|uniref:YojF family protein n=1 Tax=Bacillus sp. FJAT-49736 TaxID=2833582 RepID=UPI001BC94789|nr:YojF family protein [Bacillus sp. FJAT-49736]MBS4175357.1 YojF family protein [Bacillus sp. FJAT-49736]